MDEDATQPEPRDEAAVQASGPLFSAGAIGWCTFFFSPLVGGLMAAANHRRLGDEQKARGTAVLAVGAVVAFFAIAHFVDSPAVTGGVSGGTGALAFSWYREHKALVGAHLEAGGALRAPWAPVLAGLGLYAAVFGAVYLELHSTANVAFAAGVAAARREDWPAAEVRFREVLSEDPSRDDARYNLGLSLYNQHKYRAARRELGRVHDDSEVAADAHRLRSRISP